jgi:hypothetical protein
MSKSSHGTYMLETYVDVATELACYVRTRSIAFHGLGADFLVRGLGVHSSISGAEAWFRHRHTSVQSTPYCGI